MKKTKPLEWLVIAFVLLLLGAILFPVQTGGRPSSSHVCLSNVKQSALSLLMYTNDENDRLPPRDHWIDATEPYTNDKTIWHCPLVPKGAYGYAFNGAFSGAKEPPKDGAALTPLLYDSVNPIRNASDLCTSLPLPGRHGRSENDPMGRNSVAYADGHAKGIPARAVVH